MRAVAEVLGVVFALLCVYGVAADAWARRKWKKQQAAERETKRARPQWMR